MRRRCWSRRWRRSLWIEFLYADLWYVIIIIMFVTHDWRIISRLYPDAARMKTKPPKNPGEKQYTKSLMDHQSRTRPVGSIFLLPELLPLLKHSVCPFFDLRQLDAVHHMAKLS